MIRLTCEAEPNNLPPPGKCEARRRGRSAMHRTDQGARAGCLEGFIPQKQSTAAVRMQRNGGVRSAPAKRNSRSSTHIKNIKLTKKFTKGKGMAKRTTTLRCHPECSEGSAFSCTDPCTSSRSLIAFGMTSGFFSTHRMDGHECESRSIRRHGNKAAIKRNVPTVTVLLFALMIAASSDQAKTHKRLR